ncbi:hypothetical protein D3M95_08345 [Corynebacterium falsenii]|uniref:Uncharacterized protein n=2 Tax=Corynebacterium falsenii TaxID=108486 RepID=A0A418Q5W0_9CORY|nr:hypothetical protein D3M95_08345 [Corynebacterium falsenii]
MYMINSSPQSASPSPDDSGDISPVADQLDGTHTEPAQPSSPDSDSAHSDPAHVEPAQPSSVTTAPPTSHRELVTALRKLGLPSVLSARDRAQDLLRRVAVPLWLVAGFMVTVAMLNRAMAILADSPITDGESDLDLPEAVYAPLGGAVIFLVATPILGIIAAVLTSRKRSHAFASAVGVAGALVTILLPVFPSPDKLSALFWGVAITAVIFGATYIGIGSVFSWSIHRVGQEIFSLGPMIARTLPLFTLASLFLFYNAEIWQVMLPLSWPRILQVAAALGVLTLLLVSVTTRDEVQELLSNHADDLRRSERLNIVLIPSLVTIIQSLFLALLVFLFFLAFGQLSVSDATIFQWTQAQVDKTLWEHYRIPFAPTLIKVSFILSALAALNFAASAASDSSHRQRFVAPLISEVAMGLDTRAAYLTSQRVTPVH